MNPTGQCKVRLQSPIRLHNQSHVAFYDDRTGILFSGDFLLPGRLLIEDAGAYRESAVLFVDFLKARPLTHILGGHIELNTAGRAYRFGSHYHPNEHRLELARADLTALPATFQRLLCAISELHSY